MSSIKYATRRSSVPSARKISYKTRIDNILIQENINITKLERSVKDSLLNKIKEILEKYFSDQEGGKSKRNPVGTPSAPIVNFQIKIILDFINSINIRHESDDRFFDKVLILCEKYTENGVNFQSKIFKDEKDEKDEKDIFGLFKLFEKESPKRFITIDPTIIQIMIFDDYNQSDKDSDIVYSLKIIIVNNNTLTIRYTTQLFPANSIIKNFSDLKGFNKYTTSLNNPYINQHYSSELIIFLKNYIKYYNFYKKCYLIDETNCTISNIKYNEETKETDEVKNAKDLIDSKCSRDTDKPILTKTLIDYQLKYISILGKARFSNNNIILRASLITDYVMSNLLFASPTYAFISGGYKGFKSNQYGITRSGYEMAKKYNRPILTIMCNEGKQDCHQFSDATLIYGEHWGEDSIALSQLTDGAIIIAPFGGWTYIECLTLLKNEKIVGIYNDFYNILNYNKECSNGQNHSLFLGFSIIEQNNIIDYYINYYLILIFICNKDISDKILHKSEFIDCLTLGIQILMYLKPLLTPISKLLTIEEKQAYLEDIKNPYASKINILIKAFNTTKSTLITTYISENFENINNIYIKHVTAKNKEYQNYIPKNCDGIWIKPKFNLIDVIKSQSAPSAPSAPSASRSSRSLGALEDLGTMYGEMKRLYSINMSILNAYPIFTNLNNNIIFVFSDVMYLNLYLNSNLNTSYFQAKIHDKVNNLSIARLNISASRSTIGQQLLREDTRKKLTLCRSLDGVLDTRTGQIDMEDKIKTDYSFLINDTCNNYTGLLTTMPPNIKNNSS